MTEKGTEQSAKQAATQTDEGPEIRQIVLDVGRQRKKAIRQLSEGTGALVDEVNAAVAMVQAKAAPGKAAREIVPVVVLVKRSPGRSRRGRGLLGALLDV